LRERLLRAASQRVRADDPRLPITAAAGLGKGMEGTITKEDVRKVYELVPRMGLKATAKETGLSLETVEWVLVELQKRGVTIDSWLDRLIDETAQLLRQELEFPPTLREVEEIVDVVIGEEVIRAVAEKVYRRILASSSNPS